MDLFGLVTSKVFGDAKGYTNDLLYHIACTNRFAVRRSSKYMSLTLLHLQTLRHPNISSRSFSSLTLVSMQLDSKP